MILFANNAFSTVAGSISPISTTVTVATGSGVRFPSPVAPDYFIATFYKNDGSGRHEIVHVTQRNGDTMAITRAQEGTVADQWGPGDTFANLVTAEALTNILQLSQEDVQEAPISGKPYAREMATWTNAPFTPYVPPTWPPVGWPQSSMVFTGNDTGTKNALAVAFVTPSLSSALAAGMLFTVTVANTNDGPCTMSVQGGTAHPIKMQDGLAVEAGKITAGNMMLFWFDGTNFVAPIRHVEPPPPIVVPPEYPPPDVYIPPIYEEPPPMLFYVEDRGKDTISDGYGLSSGRPWKTLAYAVSAIQSHYASRPSVTVYCKGEMDGTDVSGQHVAEWHFIADYRDCWVKSKNFPYGFRCILGAKVFIEGFLFKTAGWAVYAGSNTIVYVKDCAFERPTGGFGIQGHEAALYVYPGGQMYLRDDISYDPRDHYVHNCFLEVHGSICYLAHEIERWLCHIKFDQECHFNYGWMWAHDGATVNCWHDGCGFIGGNYVYGPRYRCESGSGISDLRGDHHFFPGNAEGWCDDKSYSWYR